MFSPFIFLLHSVKPQTHSIGVCCKLLAQSHYLSCRPRQYYKLGFYFSVSFSFLLSSSTACLWMLRRQLCGSNHVKTANKPDQKQQTQCFVQRSRQLIMIHCYLYYRFAIAKNKVEVQWVLNKHPEATGEPSKKQELCFLADLLLRKLRATMALGCWKTNY